MVVYNIKPDLCEGLYVGTHVWDGKRWGLLGDDRFPSETDVLIDKRDPSKPEHYQIGKFGSAGWWMLENLRAEKWPDGTSTGLYKDTTKPNGDPTERYAYYYYPKLDETDLQKNPHHGYMYNWYAASRLTAEEVFAGVASEGKQGICPDGWHLPTYAEWLDLQNAIYSNPCQYAHSKINADTSFNMQSMEDAHNGKSRSISQGGFNANLLGRITGSQTGDVGQRAYFYTSDNDTNPSVWSRPSIALDADVNQMARFPHVWVYLLSVRCKKN